MTREEVLEMTGGFSDLVQRGDDIGDDEQTMVRQFADQGLASRCRTAGTHHLLQGLGCTAPNSKASGIAFVEDGFPHSAASTAAATEAANRPASRADRTITLP
jgi:hypothetical protein